jgi:PKD repeat protein
VTNGRWGDYSMMAVDPSNDHTFWFTTEYTSGGWNWKTRIASFDFSPPVVEAPVAEFTANPVTIMEGQTVSFTDQSQNNPASWSWSFEGGDPATSTESNPVVTYNNAGNYDVSLEVINSAGQSSLTKQNYITVTPFVLDWCLSSSTDYSEEYISNVTFNNINNSSSGSTYSDFTDQIVDVESGLTYTLSMTPWTSGKSRREYWRVWIDYNIDGDFNDSGELVFASDNKRNGVSGQVTIPQNLSGLTRMRVSMKYGSAPGPCETFTNGEVEDYAVNISGATPQAPIAEFTSDVTEVLVGNAVNFTDLSLNNPTSWSWSFEGGTPATSMVQNPAVAYNTLGTYQVSLTVTNDYGTDTQTKTGYITVVSELSAYCESSSSSNALDWISQVDIGAFTNSSNATTYSDFTTDAPINLSPGQSASLLLTPGYTGNPEREFWRIWIDYNQDGDFEDSGEQVFAANNKKNEVSGSFVVPSDVSGQTRLRVTMKNGSSPSPCESFTYGEVEDYTVSFDGSSKPIAENNGSPDQEVVISPNPGKGVFTIDFAEKLIPGCEIRIIDMNGRMTGRYYLVENTRDLDLTSFVSGVYHVIVLNGGKQYNSRLIIQ